MQVAATVRRQQRLITEQLGEAGIVQLQEGGVLVLEQRQRGTAVGQGRVEAVADQFVILDQPVIRVLREGQRRQAQGVDHRQAVQRQRWRLLLQDGQVVIDHVVTQHEPRPVAQGIELLEGFAQVVVDGDLKLGCAVRAQRPDHENMLGLVPFGRHDFEVDDQAFGWCRRNHSRGDPCGGVWRWWHFNEKTVGSVDL